MTELLERLASLTADQRAALERRVRTTPAEPAPAPVATGARPPLSHTQQRLWFLDRLDPDGVGYNTLSAWELVGDLDRDALVAAFAAVVERHPALRTVFPDDGGEPWQHVLPAATAPVEFDEPAGASEDDRRAQAARIARQEVRRRFTLATGPLARLRIVRIGPREHHLLLTVHHIVLDGWGLSILLTDLFRAYEDLRAGRAPAWAPLTASYADFAAAQRAAGVDEAGLAHWRDALAGLPAVLELPADRPRPPRPSLRGHRVTRWLDADLTAGLHRLARKENATLFTVLLAGWQVLLARYTGRSDIPVGTPISIRPPSHEGVVGLFLNTVVLRGDLAGDPAFADLVRATTTTAFEGYEHRGVPFETLVDRLGVERDLSRNPLFQVMLALQNTPPPPRRAAGLEITALQVDTKVAKFDLNLGVTEVDGRLRCDLDAAADLFDLERAERVCEHLRELLTAAIADPGLRVSELPLLTTAEQTAIDEWNRTSTTFGRQMLSEQFFARAAETPDAPALGCEGTWLTYGELVSRVRTLAARLRRAGAAPDTVVGVCLPRGADQVVAIHAVHAAGAAYLPLEPGYPAERLEFMLGDAKPVAVVTETALAARFDRPLLVDADVAPGPGLEQPVPVPPDSLAYVIYTSGSTGRPKGVGVSHRAMVNRLAWMQEYFPLTAADRVLQKTPFSFDVSVWEYFWAFATGASLVVASPDGHRDSGYLAGLIERERVTTVHFVPSMLDAFLDEPDLGTRLPGLRRIFCSGEALPAEFVARACAALPGTELHNLYGPTEAAVDVTWQSCRGLARDGGVPIGKAVANTRLEIVDPALRRVPVGVPGELCLGGVQLARGYLGRPGLTAERFVPDPYGPAGERLYRTGDLARWRRDGTVEYLGRLDHQVKIHGFRIELGEIETALLAEPDVRAAAVLAGDGRLVAYVVPEPGTGEDADWAGRLRRSLPEHCVPRHWVRLDRMPVTANGKLDRAALTALSPSVPAGGSATPLAPGAETVIGAVWATVLGVTGLGAEDDFFAVGGDSIRSLKVLSGLREAGYAVTLAELFTHPTPRALGRLLAGRGGQAPSGAGPARTAFAMLTAADRARLSATDREDPS
ncbi:amino acid adenylation domain-containing protein [Amycolatopsis sp. OK19-0408]|uniref:Amino acid adenylation domain-containing protein n=1 Tax=Amycolatopsis iheyensis TaxID=2945988 RepID=A0A9X2NBS0_9PSEU|nr:amino acid adenylation domain-containing protein [Amycolatopsis iheyensis]MCR6485759.1 amino acid adenylation domain-containing protein [Amycolatopsis iheyensis]